jgi:hypothetical protein
MKQTMKIIFRVIAFPFIAVIILIAAIRNYFYTLWLWLSNGGELNMHDDVFNPETHREQFIKMQELLKKYDPERSTPVDTNTK